ncbi:MAG: thioesterase family protein [Desulfovibrio sp.]|jgi:acyl-CoA thioester hydrolase|nr:thioesterase family protein [Desulfovibrio sp.]
MHEFPSREIWLPHRVSYGETDCMGIVYYAQYLHFFERGRNAYIRDCGMSYANVEKMGILLPVRDASCRYRSPARYDDLVHVRTGISETGGASLVFVYEIWNEDKSLLLCEGQTRHALVTPAGRPVRMPEWFKNLCLYGIVPEQ